MLNYRKERIDFNFWKKSLLILTFMTLTPFVIATSIFAIYSLKEENIEPTTTDIMQNSERVKFLISNSSDNIETGVEIKVHDARAELIRKYLTYYKSPLVPFSELIVKESDKNNLDWRLLVAIAQQESNLCKVIPENSFNCWGWGIHSKGTLKFSSYEEGIRIIAQGLKKNYIDKGYITADQIMQKYTPLSDGSWAQGVSQFMEEITKPLN